MASLQVVVPQADMLTTTQRYKVDAKTRIIALQYVGDLNLDLNLDHGLDLDLDLDLTQAVDSGELGFPELSFYLQERVEGLESYRIEQEMNVSAMNDIKMDAITAAGETVEESQTYAQLIVMERS